MTTIGASEAEPQFSKLLDRARHGEEIVITHDGDAIAKLVPIRKSHDVERAREAIRRLREYARQHPVPNLTSEEIKSWIEEGRR